MLDIINIYNFVLIKGVALYSASAVDKDTDDCFFLSHDTKHSHK
jgi:hypothetical protein